MSFATPNQKVLSLTGTSPIFTDTERDESDRLIFVKRIPGIITAEEFATIALDYAQKGPIIDIKYRRHTGGDKTAFALIYFQEEEDGREAIKGMNGKHIEYKGQHRVLSAERASRWTQQVSRTNLYVTHLPHHWTGSDLKSVFDKFGRVLQATVLPHPEIDEQNSGAGFVRFSTEEEAALALKSTHKKPATPGSEQILEVKYAKANLSGKKNRRQWHCSTSRLSYGAAKKRKGDFLNVNPAKKIRFNARGLGQVLFQPQMQQAFQQVVTAANGQQFICVPRVMPQRMAVAQQQMLLPSGQIVQSPQAMQYAQLAQQQQAQMMVQPQLLQQAQMLQQMQQQQQLQYAAVQPQAGLQFQNAYQQAQLQQMMLQQQAAQAQAQAAQQATAQQVSDTATVSGAEQLNAAASDPNAQRQAQAQAAAQMQQNRYTQATWPGSVQSTTLGMRDNRLPHVKAEPFARTE